MNFLWRVGLNSFKSKLFGTKFFAYLERISYWKLLFCVEFLDFWEKALFVPIFLWRVELNYFWSKRFETRFLY